MKVVFEEIQQSHGGYLSRSKVPSGWLVRLDNPVTIVHGEDIKEGWDFSSTLTFIPDPDHVWL